LQDRAKLVNIIEQQNFNPNKVCQFRVISSFLNCGRIKDFHASSDNNRIDRICINMSWHFSASR